MSDIAIRVDNLSKLYHTGVRQERHDTLRDALGSFLPLISRKGIPENCPIREIRGKKKKPTSGR